jgi:hypothetical protein
MANNLTTLRKTSLMPIMALVASFLLVTGQVFNCCRLNESVSESIGKAALAVSQMVNHPDFGREDPSAKAHSRCHGHSPTDESRFSADRPDEDGSRVNAEESCLSESGFAQEAFTPSDVSQLTFFSGISARVQEMPVPRLSRFEKPRPQNKSSPPIYLLTLRILV